MIQVKPKRICTENLSNCNYATLLSRNKFDWMLDSPEEEIERDEESD
jgi:hypothetical protein